MTRKWICPGVGCNLTLPYKPRVCPRCKRPTQTPAPLVSQILADHIANQTADANKYAT